MLRLLRDGGPQSVQALADHFAMGRPSFSEQLRVLREAGLVSERKDGRQRFYRLEAVPLAEVQDWLSPYERFWPAGGPAYRGRWRSCSPPSDTEPKSLYGVRVAEMGVVPEPEPGADLQTEFLSAALAAAQLRGDLDRVTFGSLVCGGRSPAVVNPFT